MNSVINLSVKYVSNCLAPALLKCFSRQLTIKTKTLKLQQYGEPFDVILEENEIDDHVNDDEVLMKFLASPINPADINMLQGRYGIRPPLPCVPGFEGCGRIEKIGRSVKNLKVGDLVLPTMFVGSWQSHAKHKEQELIQIRGDIALASAATLSINPCTAYRMLRDFVQLHPGDVVIQNAANSGVGIAVIQLAKQMGVQTVNIVRSRPNVESLKAYLQSIGATEVLTEEELKTTTVFDKLGQPKLGLNCVGGKSAMELFKHLQIGGNVKRIVFFNSCFAAVAVTFGGMSQQPIPLTPGILIFHQITLKGFWMSNWVKHCNLDARRCMLDDLCQLIQKGDLKPAPHEFVPITHYKEALQKSAFSSGYSHPKQIFTFD